MTQPASMRTIRPMNCHPTLCGDEGNRERQQAHQIEGDPDNPIAAAFLWAWSRRS